MTDNTTLTHIENRLFLSVSDARLSHDERDAMLGLDAAMRLAAETENAAGWNHDPATGRPIDRNFGEQIALMHSELSEALEGNRKHRRDEHLPVYPSEAVEFADTIIRILACAARLGLDVPAALILKNRYNQTRADHKAESRLRNGGKAY